VVPGFEQGALLLADGAGRKFRLSWDQTSERRGGKDNSADRRRALPPGEYKLTGYRLIRKDAKGTEWFLSATGHLIRKVSIRAGETQKVDIPETVSIRQGLAKRGDRVDVQMSVLGEHHSGLSIYRAGKRIPVSYRIADALGREVARGEMKYG
jgi:hypothetical protein